MDDQENHVDAYIGALREEAIISIIEARRKGVPEDAEEFKARYREALENRCIIIARARLTKAQKTLRMLHDCY